MKKFTILIVGFLVAGIAAYSVPLEQAKRPVKIEAPTEIQIVTDVVVNSITLNSVAYDVQGEVVSVNALPMLSVPIVAEVHKQDAYWRRHWRDTQKPSRLNQTRRKLPLSLNANNRALTVYRC